MMSPIVMATAETDAEGDNRPWRSYDNHRGRAHTKWRRVNNNRRGLRANQRRGRVPGRRLISVNGRWRNRVGDDSPGSHTRQNFSRSGPRAVPGRGPLHAACKKGSRRQSRNQRFH